MKKTAAYVGIWLLGATPVMCPIYAHAVSEAEVVAVEQRAQAQQMKVKKLQAQAIQLSLELAKLNKKMIAAARQIQLDEEKTTKTEAELELLEKKLKTAEAAFNQENAKLAQNLASLQNLALYPTESLLVQPLSPVEIIRSAILLRESVPYLQEQATKIKSDMRSISKQKEVVEKTLKKLTSQKKSLLKQQKNIKKLALQKTAVRKKIEGESRKTKQKAEQLASQATDLRELMEKLEYEQDIKRRRQEELRRAAKEREALAMKRLEEEQKKRIAEGRAGGILTEDGKSLPKNDFNEDMDLINIRPERIKNTSANFAGARGNITRPARGQIITSYGQELSKGVTSKGIVIKTRASAQVIAPYDGSVIFSGPFKGYGNLIIIDHGEGYMTLLAGMNAVDTESGQMVLAGEPVGTMPDAETAKLYMEIRQDRRPINPAPWLGV